MPSLVGSEMCIRDRFVGMDHSGGILPRATYENHPLTEKLLCIYRFVSDVFHCKSEIDESVCYICIKDLVCNGVQREHNKKLNNGLPILHKVPPKRDYGRYFCIMAEKGGTSHGGLTEKLSLFFHAKKQEVNAYGR